MIILHINYKISTFINLILFNNTQNTFMPKIIRQGKRKGSLKLHDNGLKPINGQIQGCAAIETESSKTFTYVDIQGQIIIAISITVKV